MSAIDNLERVPVPRRLPSSGEEESVSQKFVRKMTENPFVLPACGVTLYAMKNILAAGYKRDSVALAKATRLRVVSQMAAVGFVTAGFVYNTYFKNSK
jgi:hypothetical protein